MCSLGCFKAGHSDCDWIPRLFHVFLPLALLWTPFKCTESTLFKQNKTLTEKLSLYLTFTLSSPFKQQKRVDSLSSAFTDRRHTGLVGVGRQLWAPAPFADLLLRRSPNLFREFNHMVTHRPASVLLKQLSEQPYRLRSTITPSYR